MRAVWGLLASAFMALRIYCKEIPDDDFLKSINNKAEDPYNYVFSNFFDTSPIDDVKFQSKEEMDMAHVENTKDFPGQHKPEEETKGYTVIPEMEDSKENKTDALIGGVEYLKENDDGSGYNSDYEDSIDDDDDDDDDDEVINKKKKDANTEKTDNTNRAVILGIQFLPPRFNIKLPKYQYKELPDINKELEFFTENKHPLTEEKNKDDFISTSKEVLGRAKRSVHPLFSRYEHYWAWYNPHRIYAPFHHSLDSVASGLIGKRAQKFPNDGVRPAAWN